jgi:DNA-binding NarL/FixJ family response regulator
VLVARKREAAVDSCRRMADMRSESKRNWDREHYFRANGPPGTPSHLSRSRIERLRELRTAGLRVWQIAEREGLSPSTVSLHTKDLVRRA